MGPCGVSVVMGASPGPGGGAGLQPCAQCGISLPAGARFCSGCGASVPAAPSASTIFLQLHIDSETARHFVVGTRCLLRLRVGNDSAVALAPVEIHAELLGAERLSPASLPALSAFQSEVASLWFVPAVAGFHALRGVVFAQAPSGERGFFRFSGLHLRIGTAQEGSHVSVVNIDQSSARVVDNSRTSFGLPQESRGGLITAADFQPVELTAIPAAQAIELAPALSRYAEAARPQDAAAGPVIRTSSVFTRFTVKAEHGAYEAVGRLGQGELASIFEARRTADGARVVIKLADDSQDNDLIQAEVSALVILRREASPQLKHLPTVLDQFHTRDGRLGTVFEYLDGFDLLEVRRRLPQGLPPRHLPWLMRRCLSVLGWAHSRGVLHGNLDPAHILLRARDHNVWIIDWCYAIVNPAQTGQSFRCINEIYSPPEVEARRPPTPASDLYSLGKCMYYVLGGDPKAGTLPDSLSGSPLEGERLHERFQRYLQFFTLDSARARAQDAWEEFQNIDRLRLEIHGPHRFEELHL